LTQQSAVVGIRPSRNDPCPCGSGKKSSAAACRHPPSQKGTGTKRRFSRFCRLQRPNRTGRSELAITLLTRAIAADPQYPSSFVSLGNVYESSGALPQAIANYRQAVAFDAESEWAHLRLGDALRQQGVLVEGAVSISRALRIKPDFLEAIKGLGDLLLKAGKPEQAVVLPRLLHLRPSGFLRRHDPCPPGCAHLSPAGPDRSNMLRRARTV